MLKSRMLSRRDTGSQEVLFWGGRISQPLKRLTTADKKESEHHKINLREEQKKSRQKNNQRVTTKIYDYIF